MRSAVCQWRGYRLNLDRAIHLIDYVLDRHPGALAAYTIEGMM